MERPKAVITVYLPLLQGLLIIWKGNRCPIIECLHFPEDVQGDLPAINKQGQNM